MICPYILSQKTEVQAVHEYDDNGRNVGDSQVDNITYTPAKCLREGCGAWRKGRCQYYGS